MLTGIRHSLASASQPLLLALGFGVLVAINLSSLWLLERSQADQASVRRTMEVDKQLLNLLRSLRRAESSQRGYLLTHEHDYLEIYRKTVSFLDNQLAELRKAVTDNPAQLKRLDALQAPLKARVTELDEVVRVRDAEGLEAAIAAIRARQQMGHVETVQSIVQEMIAEEERLLWRRTDEANRTVNYLLAVSIIGSLVILGLAIASLLLVRRSNHQRDEANRLLASANFDLEQTVAERTADLEEANQELQRYAYIVSHDLRSPLVNIMGFTAELEEMKAQLFKGDGNRVAGDVVPVTDEDIAQNYEEALGFIKASINRMDGLIHAILRLSREGQRRFQPETIDTTEFLKAIADTLAHQADQAGADIVIEDLPPIVSDRLALEQVFSNLLDNAIKYLDKSRKGHIEVRGRRVLRFAVIEVADNGRGIPEKDHQRIFDLFRRSGVQDRPGEGIGLAHVRALVRRLGGKISVKSTPGEGSVFTVTLPLEWSPIKETKDRSAA
jgi:signal transduction histidine kinase